MNKTFSLIPLLVGGLLGFSSCKKKETKADENTPVQPAASLPANLTTYTTVTIQDTTAVCSATLISPGSGALSAAGFCWDVQPNPSLSNPHTALTTGRGVFSDTLRGLEENTTYYVRAYATNAVGTAYGNEISFTTTGTRKWHKIADAAMNSNMITSIFTGNGKMYAATNHGIFLSVNEGTSWSSVGLTTMLVSEVVEFNSMLFAIASSGSSPLKLFYSSNNGSTWKAFLGFPATSSMTDIDMTSDKLIVTTNTSAFMSSDGTNWTAIADGGMLPSGSSGGQAGGVIALEVSGQEIYAFSLSKFAVSSIYPTFHKYDASSNSWSAYIFSLPDNTPFGFKGTAQALYLMKSQPSIISGSNLLPVPGLPQANYFSFSSFGQTTMASNGTDFYITTNGSIWAQLSKTGLSSGNNSPCFITANYILVQKTDGIYRLKY